MIATFLYTAALKDLLRPKRLAVWLLVILALFGISKVVVYLSGDQTAAARYAQISELLALRVLALAGAVFSTSVVAQEIEQKTITYLLTRPIDRRVLLISRTLAAATVTFLIGSLAAVATSVAVYGTAAFSNAQLGKDILACGFGALAYTSLFVLVSLLVAKGAMLINLLFAFGWETIISGVPGDIYRLSIATYLNGISQRTSSSGETGGSVTAGLTSALANKPITAGTSMAILAILSLVCIVGGAFWFRNFEYTPREDAD